MGAKVPEKLITQCSHEWPTSRSIELRVVFPIPNNPNTFPAPCSTNSCISVDDASLKIYNIRDVDTGLYRCDVATSTDNLTALMYIRVFGKSSHVHNLAVIIIITRNSKYFDNSYYVISSDEDLLRDE